MPASKTTTTVAGVANDALLILDQYSVRAKMTLATAALPTTHRASSGYYRTLTLASNHGLVPGEAFMVFGIGGTYGVHYCCYNAATPMQSLFVPASIPAPNQIRYFAPGAGTVSEATTPDTGGVLYKLGWSSLRVGMRYALPRASTWSTVANAFGVGVSHGAYPVGSALCGRWVGGGNGYNGNLIRTDATPDYVLSGTSSQDPVTVKGGPDWYNPSGTTSVVRFPIERASPGLLVVEYSPYVNSGTYNTHLRMSVVSAVTGQPNLKSDDLKTLLRHPDLFHVSTPGGLTVERNTYNFSNSSFWHWFPTTGNLPEYIEAFCRAGDQTLEIMDLGYAFTL